MTGKFTIPTAVGPVYVEFSDRPAGDFNLERCDRDELLERCRRFVDLPWTLIREEHGIGIVEVTEPGEGFGSGGDVIVTSSAEAVIGIWAADCAPVALIADTGRIVVAHAGWRGIAGGVIAVALAALEGTGPITAVIGPLIGACCYEFGAEDIEKVAAGAGVEVDEIRSTDHRGRPALDVMRALELMLLAAGVAPERILVDGRCTGCSPELYSHRRRREDGRHVMAVWRDGDRTGRPVVGRHDMVRAVER